MTNTTAHNLTDCISNHLFPADPPADDPECPICHDEWQQPGESHKAVVGTDCKHVFHSECLVAWLSSDRYTCPSCRRLLYSSSDLQCYDNDQPVSDEDEVDDYDEDGLDMDDTTLEDICTYADSQFYLWARPRVEILVREAMQNLGLRHLEHPHRFTDAVQPIIDYVVTRYKQLYFGLLWDPLPRRAVPLDDSALECRILIAMVKLCTTRYDYVGTPITDAQYSALRDLRHAHWHRHAQKWDDRERLFVERGLHCCTLRLSDFFSCRHRSDVPTQSAVWRWDRNGTTAHYLGEDGIGDYFSNDSDSWMDLTADSSRYIHQLFKEIMLSGRGFLSEVDTKEKAHYNQVAFRTHVGFSVIVLFHYRRAKTDSEDYFEPGFFEEVDGEGMVEVSRMTSESAKSRNEKR